MRVRPGLRNMARKRVSSDQVRLKAALSRRVHEIRQELFGERGGPELARRLGIPSHQWYNYELGVTIPAPVILAFQQLTGVQTEWLLEGKGEKYRSPEPLPAKVDPTNDNVDVPTESSKLGSLHESHISVFDGMSVTEDKRAEYLAALLATVPKDGKYAQQAHNLEGLNHDFRREIAVRLELALNAHVGAMPHDDLDGMKKLAAFVNSELERFGLAVQCPKTGLPAKLKATSGNYPGSGRFYFEVYIDGKRTTPTWSDVLPELVVIDSNPAIVPETPWQAAVGPKSSRTSRNRS